MDQTICIRKIDHLCCKLLAIKFNQAKDKSTVSNRQTIKQEETQTGI